MTPAPAPSIDNDRERDAAAQFERLAGRIEENERDLRRMRNTVSAVFEETISLTIAGQCTNCEQSYLVVRRGELYCPFCSYRRVE